MGKTAEHRLLSRPIRLRIFSILKKKTEKGSLLRDLIALIELTPVRSPGFEKESAVMSPLIRPEPQEEKEGQKDSLQEKKCTFFVGLLCHAGDIGDPDTMPAVFVLFSSLFSVNRTSI